MLALDVKSDWTDEDVALAERSGRALQRVEPERDVLTGRLAGSLAPTVLSPDELELLAERSVEPCNGGWRFRWDRRVLAAEPVDPFAFLSDVRCPTHVMAGSQSNVMPPDKAHRFAEAIPKATVELVDGAGHHVELDAPQIVAERILELARG